MTISFIAVCVITIILCVIGFVGIIVPVIPGLPMIWCGFFVYAAYTGWEEVTWTTLVITGIIALIGFIAEFLAGVVGVKVSGASKWAVVGVIIGGIVGMLLAQVIGLVIGSVFGAFIAEYFFHKNKERALRASVGTLIGFVGNIFVQFIFACMMISIFIFSILLF